MKALFALFSVVALAAAQLELAANCNPQVCQLPDCRCSSPEIPGGLEPRDTPQFVTITFDDAVTVASMPNYREVLYGRTNTNGCPIGATFYVSHEWTDYSAVNELYNNRFEVAMHSISHQIPQTYWMSAAYDILKLELADQKPLIARFANIPESEINGIRMPFLQLSGNNSFHVMKDYQISYDCSWPTISFNDPALWPYTLDYASIQDCPIPPCPSASLPGVWVMPIIPWYDLGNFPCSMADACAIVPDRENEDEWYKFIMQNFERHYKGNRAPFPFYLHEAYLRGWPAVKRAMIRFIETVRRLHDVFLVNTADVLKWVKNPTTVDVYRSQPCQFRLQAQCRPTSCALTAAHNNWNYYMTVCGTCPNRYPWVGNPLGN